MSMAGAAAPREKLCEEGVPAAGDACLRRCFYASAFASSPSGRSRSATAFSKLVVRLKKDLVRQAVGLAFLKFSLKVLTETI
jgi:hypothetical protein